MRREEKKKVRKVQSALLYSNNRLLSVRILGERNSGEGNDEGKV